MANAQDKLQSFLEANAEWMMPLDPTVVMDRIAMALQYGEREGRSVEDSLEAAKQILLKTEKSDG